MPEGETTHTEETGPHDDVEKPEAAPADNSAEELKQALEEAEARAEEAEQRADEAEEARDEARAQETEQALEEEKKKKPAKETRKSPKTRGIPANRLGQPLRPASPNSHTHLQRPCGHLEQMKQLDESLERKPQKRDIMDMVELRIRNLQAFDELQSFNDTGKFLLHSSAHSPPVRESTTGEAAADGLAGVPAPA